MMNGDYGLIEWVIGMATVAGIAIVASPLIKSAYLFIVAYRRFFKWLIVPSLILAWFLLAYAGFAIDRMLYRECITAGPDVLTCAEGKTVRLAPNNKWTMETTFWSWYRSFSSIDGVGLWPSLLVLIASVWWLVALLLALWHRIRSALMSHSWR